MRDRRGAGRLTSWYPPSPTAAGLQRDRPYATYRNVRLGARTNPFTFDFLPCTAPSVSRSFPALNGVDGVPLSL
jgi:hypothetical protein